MAQRTDQSAIPDALKNFDSLPDSANVRQPVVQGLFGCSHATIWRNVKKGIIPAPRKLSAYSTPKPPHISVQTLPAIPAETGHPLHPKPYHPFQSKVGHPFQSKPAVQAG